MRAPNAYLIKILHIFSTRRGTAGFCSMERSKRIKVSAANVIAPSNVTLEILSNGASSMPPSVFIRTPLQSYFFNCPEGVYRFSSLHRVRPNQIQDIFITKDKWKNVSGISGVVLSKMGSGENVRLHGPPSVAQIVKTLRPMLDMDFGGANYPVKIEHCDSKRDCFEDSTLYVNYLQVENGEEKRYLETGSSCVTNTAFLVKLKPCLPPIDSLKLIELKIPRSPLISKLKAGETVTLEDGRIIRPDDVIDHKRKLLEFPYLLVVDISSMENLNSISKNFLLQDFMHTERSQQMNYIVHFTRQNIFDSDDYKEWLRAFGDGCTHLLVNCQGRAVPQNNAVYNIQNWLNSIFPQAFPDLYPFGRHFDGEHFTQDDERWDRSLEIDGAGSVFIPAFLRRYSLRGAIDKDELNAIFLELNHQKFLDERVQAEPEELPKQLQLFKKALDEVVKGHGNGQPREIYPTTIFLGTSSAIATKYRNVTAHLLQLSDTSNFLVDCGEGTLGQLWTLFGPCEVEKVLLKLHAIFITHSHQDHILGLFDIVQKRVEAFEKHELPYRPLVLVCDRSVFNLIKAYSDMFSDLKPYIFALNLATLLFENSNMENVQAHKSSVDLMKHLPKNIFSSEEWNLSAISAFQVQHTKWSCGYSFVTEREKRKIVFSGDTKPCENLVKHGKGADLLIHECTFEDGLEEDAMFKKHSTMRQAFDASVQMGAKNVIFTHFSARYHLVPPLPDYILKAGNVSVANDLMTVNFDLLPLFPKLLPVYRQLYKEELFDFEMKTLARGYWKGKNQKESGGDEKIILKNEVKEIEGGKGAGKQKRSKTAATSVFQT